MAQVPSNLIPTRLTQLMTDSAPSTQGLMMYVRNGVNYQVRVGDLLDTYARVTSVDVSGGATGLTTSGGPVTTTGTITLDGTLNLEHGGTGATSAAAAPFALKGENADITSMTGVSGGISTPDFVQFDTTVTPTPAVGKLGWDVEEHGLSVMLTGGNVNLQVGQETVLRVYNNTGSAMTDGQVVYCTGSQGQRLTVALALANSDLTSAAIIGVVTEPIPNNAEGFITVQGRVSHLNTSGFADGAVIYLSPTVPGAWTTTKPQAPDHTVMVGYVVKGNSAGAGSIYIHVQNGYELDELHDVKITAVAEGQLLQYDSTIPAWKNVTGISGGTF